MDKNVIGTGLLSRARGITRSLGAALALVTVISAEPHSAIASSLKNNVVTESMLAARPHDIVLGPAQAPVTLVTYTEHHNNGYAGPWLNSLRPLRQKYGNSLRIIVRDYIVAGHNGADLGASAAHGVFERRGEKAYLDFVEALASPQFLFVTRNLAAEATRVGAGPAPGFESDLDSEVWANRVATNKADVQAAQMDVMPAAFINGQRLSEVVRLDNAIPAIDAELTAAKALETKQGVHGASLSLARTRENLAAIAKLRAEDATREVRPRRPPPGVNVGMGGSPVASSASTASSAPAASADAELDHIIEIANAKFCQAPASTTCQIMTKFRQGQLPQIRGAEALSLGAMYQDGEPLPNLPPYLALRLRPQGAALEAASITLTPESDVEQQKTETYLQSIRAGRRDPAASMHRLLERQLDAHSPPLKIERQKDALLISWPGSPGGFWVRQLKNEWIVLHFAIARGGFRMVPIISLIVMPID